MSGIPHPTIHNEKHRLMPVRSPNRHHVSRVPSKDFEQSNSHNPLFNSRRLIIRDTNQNASMYMARHIVKRINEYGPTGDRPFVLGLPTGSSPELNYRYLVDFYRAGEISFRNVVTFNMVPGTRNQWQLAKVFR
jgi:hypothetical protein